MFKWLHRKLRPVRHTELALEIKEALENDEWEVCEYSIKHCASGMELWIDRKSRDADYFHIHRLPNGTSKHATVISREDAQSLMTKADHEMLFELAQRVLHRLPMRHATITLNALRLARQTNSINP